MWQYRTFQELLIPVNRVAVGKFRHALRLEAEEARQHSEIRYDAHANSTVSLVHTALRNHAPTTIRSTASQMCGTFMLHLCQQRHNRDGGMLELDYTNVNAFFIDD